MFVWRDNFSFQSSHCACRNPETQFEICACTNPETQFEMQVISWYDYSWVEVSAVSVQHYEELLALYSSTRATGFSGRLNPDSPFDPMAADPTLWFSATKPTTSCFVSVSLVALKRLALTGGDDPSDETRDETRDATCRLSLPLLRIDSLGDEGVSVWSFSNTALASLNLLTRLSVRLILVTAVWFDTALGLCGVPTMLRCSSFLGKLMSWFVVIMVKTRLGLSSQSHYSNCDFRCDSRPTFSLHSILPLAWSVFLPLAWSVCLPLAWWSLYLPLVLIGLSSVSLIGLVWGANGFWKWLIAAWVGLVAALGPAVVEGLLAELFFCSSVAGDTLLPLLFGGGDIDWKMFAMALTLVPSFRSRRLPFDSMVIGSLFFFSSKLILIDSTMGFLSLTRWDGEWWACHPVLDRLAAKISARTLAMVGFERFREEKISWRGDFVKRRFRRVNWVWQWWKSWRGSIQEESTE